MPNAFIRCIFILFSNQQNIKPPQICLIYHIKYSRCFNPLIICKYNLIISFSMCLSQLIQYAQCFFKLTALKIAVSMLTSGWKNISKFSSQLYVLTIERLTRSLSHELYIGSYICRPPDADLRNIPYDE